MRQTLTSLALVGMVVAGFWPGPGLAEEAPALPALSDTLEQDGQIEAITLSPGFGSFPQVSGLTDPRGVVDCPPLTGFPCSFFVVEKSLNRVSVAPRGGSPTSFATGLSAPTDLSAPRHNGTDFGLFLYVVESGAKQIAKIDSTGAVTTFVPSSVFSGAAPKRLAFSNRGGGSAFGDFLFVTLTDGRVVRVDKDGLVSACASGFTSPADLVFGPGGALRTNTLYVADSGANNISQVKPKPDGTCDTPSTFASTGLTAPTGLAISQSVPWGPLETTLYVVHTTGTKVDRVDKHGTVTPFASGVTLADTIRFASFVPVSDRLGPNLHITDATAGTVVDVFVFRPTVRLELGGCAATTCHTGDLVTVTLIVKNDGPIPLPVEAKTGFRLVNGEALQFATVSFWHRNLGDGGDDSDGKGHDDDNVIILPPLWPEHSFLWVSFRVPHLPPGHYCYQASVIDPEVPFFNPYTTANACFRIAP